MLDIPGARLEVGPHTNPTGPSNGVRLPIRSRGTTTYIVRTNVPIAQARVFWAFRGRTGLATQFLQSGRCVAIPSQRPGMDLR